MNKNNNKNRPGRASSSLIIMLFVVVAEQMKPLKKVPGVNINQTENKTTETGEVGR